MNGRIMTLRLRNENQILQELMDNCKKIIGKNLKAIVLFGSRASGTAKNDSDFDVLIIADDLPQNWRQRDTIILDLDRHGIFDIFLYTGEELENAINRKAQLFTDEVEQRHILRMGNNTWKISGGINV